MPNIAQTPYAAPVSGHPPLSPACRCVIPILLVSQASMRSTPSAVTMARRRSRSSTASTPSRGSPRSLRREPGCAMQANIRWVLCCGSSLEQKAVCARCVSPVTLGALKVRFTVCVEPCTTKTKLHGRRGGGGGTGERPGDGRDGRVARAGVALGAFPLPSAHLWSPWPMLLAGRPGRTRAHVPGIYRIESESGERAERRRSRRVKSVEKIYNKGPTLRDARQDARYMYMCCAMLCRVRACVGMGVAHTHRLKM